MDIKSLILDELESAKTALKMSARTKGLTASGEFEESLEVFVDGETDIHAGVKAAAHAWEMEYGRGPNKRQDKGMIAFIYHILLEWMEVKGVHDINPWMAARKIVMEGIKVPNKYNPGGVLSDVINDEWLDQLQEKILEVQNLTFMEEITSILKGKSVTV